MVRDTCVRLYRKFLAWFQGEEEDGPLEFIGVQDDHGFWSCRFCSRSGMQKKYPDLFRHVWREHYWVNDEDVGMNEEGAPRSTSDDFSVGDYVDDYSLERVEDDPCGEVNIQEPTGGVDEDLRMKQLRSKYSGLIQELKRKGRVEIHETTHYGGMRGKHIVREFKKDAKRMDLEFDVKESGDRGSRTTELIAEY